MDNYILQLEESLQILEELLQCDSDDRRAITCYIKRLKQFYSPQFDFEHSESGSYYYAALKCLSINYLDSDAVYNVSMSVLFKDSLQTLMDIALHNVDSPSNKTIAINKLVELASLWGFNSTFDMVNLIVQILQAMRTDLLATTNYEHNGSALE